ncbi:predicted protein [Chaetomium globosum CBS 148.51]|uniref:Uncharacterized protein n=1 Tax=Chaetomium globosum (strain ATCC 6205 / CBS 148.51 / DSM 1962 / NBRC 6347 / NRRL 1970) TaxID=306901 RepID=Q2H587_CHAGB|nr:uncharacterized protein CHGG_06178 [Chaetomium globosum CBS 148.51]EAQ89559.1 predicted protein [Chaetomium globosum CBS 148.51]
MWNCQRRFLETVQWVAVKRLATPLEPAADAQGELPRGPQYDKLHHALGMRTGAPRAQTANPLSHCVAGFSSSTAELEVPHWIEGWRPGGLLRRGRRAVRLGPAGAGRVRH